MKKKPTPAQLEKLLGLLAGLRKLSSDDLLYLRWELESDPAIGPDRKPGLLKVIDLIRNDHQ